MRKGKWQQRNPSQGSIDGRQELGIESEIIRAMELKVRQCNGCETCSMLMAQGKESKCAIKDDDVPWIHEKIL